VVRREALVDEGAQVLADRLASVPIGNAEVAYGVFREAVEAFAECLFDRFPSTWPRANPAATSS
jgi:hypothetical protein